MHRFSWSRWLRSLLRPEGKASRKRTRHLKLEQLENRLAPASFTWSGALALQTGNRDWSMGSNWQGNVAPTGSTASLDSLIFPAGLSGQALIPINDLPLVNGVVPTFNSITIFGSGYSFTGNAIGLGNSTAGTGSIIAGTGAANDNIGFNIQFNGAAGNQQSITANLTSSLTISGNISGTTQLVKFGTGTLILSGSNSGFTGTFTINSNSGIVEITTTNALGASGSTTTVDTGSQLMVANVTGNILENLILNGPGVSNGGALLSGAGTGAAWAGNIELDSDSTIGASANSMMHITGVISDTGAGHNLTKEGTGQLFLDAANTYRGLTTINDGILTVENGSALGAGGSAQSGTVVNSSPSEQGTLQLNSLTAGGFSVLNENLTLSGEGVNLGTITNPLFLGALDSSFGSNTWAGSVNLSNPGAVIGYGGVIDNYIGVDADPNTGLPTRLTISGIISGGFNPTTFVLFGFTKIGVGRLVLTNANTYGGGTEVLQGYLQVCDSDALGGGASPVDVSDGASLELADDNNPDSVTGKTNTHIFSNPLNIFELGDINVNTGLPEGALDSVSGINTWAGSISLVSEILGSFIVPNTDAIGVEPDPNASSNNNYFANDFSLTITGGIFGGGGIPTANGIIGASTTFAKVGFGQLILPTANTYTGPTDIQQGWVTIENNQSLGVPGGTYQLVETNNVYDLSFPQIINPSVVTTTNEPSPPSSGPDLTLESNLSATLAPVEQPPTIVENGASLQLRALTPGGGFTLSNNLILSGNGISQLSSNFGELVQQGALLNLNGNNTITGNIQLNGNAGIGVQTSLSALQTVTISGLSVTGGTFTLTFNGQTTQPLPFNASASAVQTALDSLSSIGTVGGSVSVNLSTSTNPLLSVYAVSFSGLLGGLNLPAMKATSNLQGINAAATVAILQAGGPLAPSALSELTLTGTLTDGTSPGGITKLGSGRLDIEGNGSYTGQVIVAQGVLRAASNTALGSAAGAGGTTVQSGASLELMSSIAQNDGGVQAGISVFNNHLTLNGTGDAAFDDGALTNIGGDNLWRGPTTLGSSATIDVFANTRLTLLGAIDDTPIPSSPPASLTKLDAGELVLAGANTYRGNTMVNQGILTVANTQGLGAGSGQTVVANGGQLQVEGGVTLAGEPLVIQGSGTQQPDVQSISLGGTQTGSSYTLSFNGKTTPSLAFDATALQVQAALNALSTISGLGGSVSVYQPQADTYAVAFFGSLAGQSQQLMTANASGGMTVSIAKQIVGGSAIIALPSWYSIGPGPVENGQDPGNMPVSGRVTSIATDPTDANVIYIATAGGGAWTTTNGGQTWEPLFDGISTVYSVTSSGGAGSFTLTFESQTTVSLPANATVDQVEMALDALSTIGGAGGYVNVTQSGNIYTVTFSGSLANTNLPFLSGTFSGGATGSVAQVKNGVSSQVAMFSGAIAVAPSSPNIIYLGTGEADNSSDSFYGTGVYESTNYGQTWTLLVDKTGNPLYGQAISQLIVDPYTPTTIYLSSGNQASNSPAGKGTPGIWRYDGTSWFNLTSVTSTVRQTQFASAPTGTPPVFPPPPKTPGPDDNYKISFPQVSATWSDLALVYVDVNVLPFSPIRESIPEPIAWSAAVGGNPSSTGSGSSSSTGATGTAYIGNTAPNTLGSIQAVPLLFAALGSATGSSANGVYWSPNILGSSASNPPDWYLGNPFTTGSNAAGQMTATLAPDVPMMNDFPAGSGNGSIKLSAFVTENPGFPSHALYPTNLGNVTIVATVALPSLNSSVPKVNGQQVMRDQIYESTDGGFDWSAFTNPPVPGQQDVPPTDFLGYQGGYDSAVLLTSPKTFYVAGEMSIPNLTSGAIYPNPPTPGQANPLEPTSSAANTEMVYQTTDGGLTWTDITTDVNGNGPHDDVHSLNLNENGQILAGTDGGIWQYDPTTKLWTDLNGNLGDLLTVSAAVSSINPNAALAGISENGTALFTGSPGWASTDSIGGSGGDVAIDPLDPSTVYQVVVTTLGVTLQTSSAGGAPGTWTTITPPVPGSALPLGAYPLAVPVPMTSPVLSTWQQPAINAGALFPLVLDGVNPSRLVMGGVRFNPTYPGVPPGGPVYEASIFWGGFSLEQSLDGGATWSNLSPNQNSEGTAGLTLFNQLPFDFTVTQIGLATYQGTFASDPSFPQVSDLGSNTYNPNTIYVIGFSETTGVPALYVTKDGGTDWVERDKGLPLNVMGSITVDPRNRDVAYYTVPTAPGTNTGSNVQRVFMTTNAGQTWTDISTGLPDVPTYTLVVDPRNGNLYVGNDAGVWFSTNQGVSWQHFGAGMPNVEVRQLALNQTLNVLTAATYGRGVYELFLDYSQNNAGAVAAVTGENVWTGPVSLTGSTPGSTVALGAAGSQLLQNGVSNSQITFAGPISDATVGGDYQLVKVGPGNVALAGPSTYGGLTQVQQGDLITENALALGSSNAPDLQSINVSGTSGSFTLTFNGQTTSALSFQPVFQTILLSGSTSGSFTLTFNGQITPLLPYTSTAAAVQSALDALTSIGGVGGSVTVTLSGNLYKVIFGGSLSGQEPQITGAGTNGTNVATNILPTNIVLPEVQSVAVGGTSGSFTLTFMGQTTASLPFSASAASIQSALNGLSTIGGAGGTVSVSQSGSQYVITFGGALSGINEPQLIVQASGGMTALVTTVTDGATGALAVQNALDALTSVGGAFVPQQQTINAQGGPSGTYTLAFNGQTTAALPYSAPASTIQSALNGLSSIAGVGGLVTASPAGSQFTVTFGGSLAASTQPQITPTGSGGTNASFGTLTNLQTVFVAGTTTGSFTLTFNGVATSSLPFTSSASAVQSALDSLSTIGTAGGFVIVSESSSQTGNQYTVNFGGTLASNSDPVMVALGTGGTTATVTTAQTFAVSGTTSGTFTLTFNGKTTSALPFTATASAIQAALINLTTIGGVGGSVTVTLSGSQSTVSFLGSFANQVEPLIVATGSGGAFANVTSVSSQQSVFVNGSTSGSFTLTFNGETTAALPFTATASAVQSALDSLAAIGGVGGSVTVVGISGGYAVTFGGALAGAAVPQIIGTGFGGDTVSVTTTTQGASPATNGGSVTVAETGTVAGNVFTVTFGGTLANLNVPQITATATAGTNVTVNTVAIGGIGTQVLPGAALEVASNIQGEPIVLAGNGIAFNGHNTGALRNIAGSNTITGSITLEQSSTSSSQTPTVTIGVESGSQLTIGTATGLNGTGTITDISTAVNPKNNPISLTKELTGTLVLASADSYHGNTVVNQGALQLQNSNALGATSTGNTPSTTVLDGAQLQLQTPLSGPNMGIPVVVPNQTLIVSGSGINNTGAFVDDPSGVPSNFVGSNTWQGNIGLAQNPGFSPTTTPPNSVTISVPVTALSNGQPDTLTVTGSVGQSGATMGLTKIGNGRLLLVQADNYAGATAINGGTLGIENAQSLGLSGSAVTVSNGAALELDGDPNGVGASIAVVNHPLTLNGTGTQLAKSGSFVNANGNNSWGGAITLASSTVAGLPSAYVDAIGASAGTSLAITGSIGGVTAATLTKLGLGTVDLATADTYLGLTQVQAGILNIGNSAALGPSGVQEVQTLLLTGSPNGTFSLTFEGQNTPQFSATAPAVTVQAALNNLSTIGGPVGGSVAVKLTGSKYTLTFGGTLAGVNVPQVTGTGFGGATVTASTVSDGGGLGTVVASGATLQVQGGINVSTEPLTLSGNGAGGNGALESVSGSNVWGQPITMATNISIGSDSDTSGASTLILNQPLMDNGSGFSLTKVGTGTLQFTGNLSNAYSGATNVNLGTLQLDDQSGALAVLGNLTIGTGSPANPPTATVQLMANSQIAPTSSVTIKDGLFDLENQTQMIGPLNMTGGIVDVKLPASLLTLGSNVTAAPDSAGNAAVFEGPGTISLGGTTRLFTINGLANSTPSMIISAVLTGTGTEGLTKVGLGTLQFLNDNTFNGTTSVTQGIVLADGPNTATTIGAVALNGGTLGGKGTVGPITSIASGTVAPGDNSTSTGTLGAGTTTWIGTTQFLLTLDGPSSGQFSQLAINGNINLGSATLAALPVSSNIPAGTQLPIITATGGNISGVFSNAAPNSIITLGGQKFSITYTTNQVILNAAPKNNANINLEGDFASTGSLPLYGEDVKFIATVTPVTPGTGPIPTTDTVTFTLDGTTYPAVNINSSGQATLDPLLLSTPLTLSVGPHTLTAVYSGDGDWNSNSATPLNFNVIKANVNITFSTFPASPVVGQPLSVIATLTAVAPGAGVPTGTVTFTEDGVAQSPTTISAGAATFSVGTLTAPHTFQANYNGDSNFSSSTSSTFSVSVPVATTIAIASSKNPSVYGQLAITANVQGKGTSALPTGGTVTFFVVNGASQNSFKVPLTSANPGVATLPAADLPLGSDSITASYSGDTSASDNFLPSGPTAALAQVVNKAATTAALSASTTSLVAGQNVTFTATITGTTPSTLNPTDGTVTFVVDGVNVPVTLTAAHPGIATFTTSFVSVTTHTVSASYGGGTNFSASGPSPSVMLNVAKANSNIALGSSVNPANTGQSVTFTATVSGATPSVGKPTSGTVTFVIDGVSHQVQLSSTNPGVASFTTSFSSSGSHTVTASYGGNTSFSASGTTPTLTENISLPANIAPASLSAAVTTGATIGNPFTIRVTALTSQGRLANVLNGPTTMTVLSVPTVSGIKGALNGPLTSTFLNGVAMYAGLTITEFGTYTVMIKAGGLQQTFSFTSFNRRTGA
jgi:large repetitive protein